MLFIAPYAGTPEMAVLDVAALCAPDEIVLDVLREASGLEAEAFGVALGELVSAGVLQLYNHSVNIRRLTQVSVRGHMARRGPAAKPAALTRLLESLVAFFADTVRNEFAPRRTTAIPHVDAAVGHASARPRDAVEGAAALLPHPRGTE